MPSRNVVSETSPQYVLQSEMGKSSTQYSSIFKVIGNYLAGWLCNVLILPLQDFLEMQMTECYSISAVLSISSHDGNLSK